MGQHQTNAHRVNVPSFSFLLAPAHLEFLRFDLMIVSGVATGTKLILNEVDPAEKFRAVFGSQTRLLQCRSLLVGRWRRGASFPA